MTIALIASAAEAAPATGPLRVHPQNPRYFADASGKPVYLTGSHTWDSLVDMTSEAAPEKFDFNRYLDFLERHHHNFIRLWAWDSATWDTRANGESDKKIVLQCSPLPWARTGPGLALDGKPRFDLTKFNPEFFERLRSRVRAAGERGLYVSVMLFEGWGLMHGNRGRAAPNGWAWRAHPFHPDNNVNGVNPSRGSDGVEGDVHNKVHARVNALQADYIRKVVETVNEFDHVLYEVINEGGEKEWDWWVADTIRAHERTLPKQHPIGITGHGAERLDSMLASPADWISPGSRDGYRDDPPAWTGRKVSLLDTDHIWGLGGHAGWVWKSFFRGHNPIFMDPYDGAVLAAAAQQHRWESVRRALGAARRVAERVDLAALTPQPKLASTEYCLAAPGSEYLVFQPKPGEDFTVTLPIGAWAGEWLDPHTGKSEPLKFSTTREAARRFRANFDGIAVLHIRRTDTGAAR